MSMRQDSVRRGRGRSRSNPSIRLSRMIDSVLEKLEDRRLLSGDVRLVGITGNQQNPAHLDETLYDIHWASTGTTDPAFLDGFEDVKPNPPDTQLSIQSEFGVTQGNNALRVDVEPGPDAFWGIRTGNVIDQIRAGATTFLYDLTLINKELNGGSYGGGTDNSFNGYAQNNELAVVINTPTDGFIQRDFTTAHGTDSSGNGATWAGVDGTRTITWDLSTFTSEGMSLSDFIAAHNATDVRIWLTTQGLDTNGHVGPMRFYFDNFQLGSATANTLVGDFELLNVTPIITLPHVPDTDSIGFNPETGLLHRVSGSGSYRDNPDKIGYHDNQFMETIDLNSPGLDQVGIFNADYEGERDTVDGAVVDTGPYGLPAPFPTFVLPDHRRADGEPDPGYGPDEYHGLRDLTWSTTDHLFYGADERGIFTLTADGTSHFIAYPKGLGDIAGDPKAITFYTTPDGVRRLVISERDGPNLWMLDPATGNQIASVVMRDKNASSLPGVLSLVEDPTSTFLLGIAKSVDDPGNPYARELVRIDPATGDTTSLGVLGVHMADLAFIVSRPSVVSSQFLYEDSPQRLVFSFSQNVGASLTAADLTLEKLGAGGGPVAVGDPQYDFTNNTVTFPINGVLADGNYRATLGSAGVTNTLDMPITANEEVNFYWLNGDLNRDGSVTISDFLGLASNFGANATKWSDGDLNYDGVVSISDFLGLASNFGKTVLPPAAAPQAAAGATVSGADSGTVTDSSNDVLDVKESAVTSSNKTSRRRAHHHRRVHKAEQHLIGRAGSY